MLHEELLESLKKLDSDIDLIKDFWQKSSIGQKIQSLEKESSTEDFWQRKDQATVLKELQSLKTFERDYQKIILSYDSMAELIELFSQNEDELSTIEKEIKTLKRELHALKLTILLSKPDDQSNCFISINAGAGGTESQDWAEMLLRMYVRFCERHKFNVAIMDYQTGEGAGIKSATLFVKGLYAYGLLKSEHGIHRLVRISPFDANKRRHTSFAGVSVTAEVPEVEVSIDQKDLRIDTYRAGGAGGQHVNKTESAVRITHIPTNTVVQCQSERSQIQNRETAMKMLYAKLAQQLKEEQEAQKAGIEKKKIEWGSQIRSYILHPYKMVKDHRTDAESPQPDLVLDGDLTMFIESYLGAKAHQ
jgi:peptide chain release factor 2